MSSSSSSPLSPAPSDWAFKYGFTHPTLKNEDNGDKSGLTPIKYGSLLRGTVLEDQAYLENKKRAEEFQKRQLYLFTTQELVDLDAITDRDLKPSTLKPSDSLIWSPWKRENWLRSNEQVIALYRVNRHGDLRLPSDSGKWAAGDSDFVWNIVKPVLTIATKMANTPKFTEFLDILISGHREPIGRKRKGKSTNLIYLKNPQGARRRSQRISHLHIVQKLADFLRLGFKYRLEDPHTRVEEDTTGSDAFTTCEVDANDPKNLIIHILFDYEKWELLLRNDLNDLERMGLQYHLATVVLHETTHALWNVIYGEESFKKSKGKKREVAPSDPYFLDENLLELGLAMEQYVLGGFSTPMLRRHNAPSFGYWVKTGWPSMGFVELCEPKTKIRKPAGLANLVNVYPIQATYFEDVHQKEFWDVAVRKFGIPALKMRALGVGTRITHRLVKQEQEVVDTARSVDAQRRMELDTALSLQEKLKRVLGMGTSEKQAYELSRTIQRNMLAIEDYAAKAGLIAELTADFQDCNLQLWGLRRRLEDVDPDEADPDVDTLRMEFSTLVEQQVTKLRLIIEAHMERVGALWKLMKSGDEYSGRREELAVWNADTRRFLRQLQDSVGQITDVDDTIVETLEELDIKLEITKLKLGSDGFSTPEGIELYDEDKYELEKATEFSRLIDEHEYDDVRDELERLEERRWEMSECFYQVIDLISLRLEERYLVATKGIGLINEEDLESLEDYVKRQKAALETIEGLIEAIDDDDNFVRFNWGGQLENWLDYGLTTFKEIEDKLGWVDPDESE